MVVESSSAALPAYAAGQDQLESFIGAVEDQLALSQHVKADQRIGSQVGNGVGEDRNRIRRTGQVPAEFQSEVIDVTLDLSRRRVQFGVAHRFEQKLVGDDLLDARAFGSRVDNALCPIWGRDNAPFHPVAFHFAGVQADLHIDYRTSRPDVSGEDRVAGPVRVD